MTAADARNPAPIMPAAPNKPKPTQRDIPAELVLRAEDGSGGGRLSIVAADPAQQASGPARVGGIAYSGGALRQWWGTTVVDVAGIKSQDRVGLILNHGFGPESDSCEVGVLETIDTSAGVVRIEGRLLANTENEAARRIAANAREGYPYEYSIRVDIERTEELPPGVQANVNNQQVIGPVTIVRASRLREISVCHVGADPYTQFQIAASRRGDQAMSRKANEPSSVAGAASPDETVRVGDITAEWMQTNLPEVFTSIKSMGAEPAKEAAASADDVAAIFGVDNSALCFRAMREKWTPTRCRDEARKASDESVAALTKERDELKKRLDAIAASGAAPLPASETKPAPAASGVFAGAEGKDPAADWKNSEALRKHYGESEQHRASFLRFAAQQMSRGESYLD